MARAKVRTGDPPVSRYALKKKLEDKGVKPPFEFVDVKKAREESVAQAEHAGAVSYRVRMNILVTAVDARGDFALIRSERGVRLFLGRSVLRSFHENAFVGNGYRLDCDIESNPAKPHPGIVRIHEIIPRE